jgi:hypothetical protein
VNDHDRGVFGHLGEGGDHRGRPRLPSRHDRRHLAGPELLRQNDARLLPTGRSRDNDPIDPVRVFESPERLGNQWQIPESRERLRSIFAQPFSPPCGSEYGPN